VMRFDRAGRILFASGNTRAALGLDAAEAIGKTHAELGLPVEQCRFWEESLSRVFGSGQLLESELVPTCQEQSPQCVTAINCRMVPERDMQGAVSTVLSICRDITAQRRIEREYKTLFREMLDGFALHEIVCDSTGAPVDYRFLAVNPAFERMVGLGADEVVGRTALDVLPGIEPNRIEAYGRVAQTGEPFSFEDHSADLSRQYAVTAFRPAPGQFATIVRDITARKQAEAQREGLQAQLTQAQKMESVGRLAGGVAHDFNNMLGAILGHAELALRRAGPSDPLYTRLTEIRNAAQRSAALTRQLLAFARKQTVIPQALDLNKTVESMLRMLRRLIGEDIELSWKPADDLWPVWMDPVQVDQILANLCVNARDAIAGAGSIGILTRNVVLDGDYCARHSGTLPGDRVLLAVSDSGCGMDAETLSHLFEPFFTTKDIGKGTGLGLSTVYGAVTQNNGYVDVRSEPGQGTTFSLYFPRHTLGGDTHPQERQPPDAARGSETILLVEDEPTLLLLTKSILSELGYSALAADTPRKAMEIAREHSGRIDLLITDVVMPGMNGRELANNLLTVRPDIRCLYMSGYTGDAIARHGILNPGMHFVQKPFSVADLAQKIRQALS